MKAHIPEFLMRNMRYHITFEIETPKEADSEILQLIFEDLMDDTICYLETRGLRVKLKKIERKP